FPPFFLKDQTYSFRFETLPVSIFTIYRLRLTKTCGLTNHGGVFNAAPSSKQDQNGFSRNNCEKTLRGFKHRGSGCCYIRKDDAIQRRRWNRNECGQQSIGALGAHPEQKNRFRMPVS